MRKRVGRGDPDWGVAPPHIWRCIRKTWWQSEEKVGRPNVVADWKREITYDDTMKPAFVRFFKYQPLAFEMGAISWQQQLRHSRIDRGRSGEEVHPVLKLHWLAVADEYVTAAWNVLPQIEVGSDRRAG